MEPAGYESAETLRIAAGILRYGLDFNENTFLPETNLDILCVSETKGCYPGKKPLRGIELTNVQNDQDFFPFDIPKQ